MTVTKRSQLRGQSGKTHIVLLLSKVPSDFDNRILRNYDSKKRLIKPLFEYNEKEAKDYLELLGSSEIILSSESKSQEEADTKLLVHAHNKSY